MLSAKAVNQEIHPSVTLKGPVGLQKDKPPELSEGICVQSLFGKKTPPTQESGFKVSSLVSIYEYLETHVRGGISKECVCSPREWRNTESIFLKQDKEDEKQS